MGDCVPTGRVSHAGLVKSDDPDDPGPPGWGLDVRPTASSRKKLMSRQPQRRLGWNGAADREEWRRLLKEARDQKNRGVS